MRREMGAHPLENSVDILPRVASGDLAAVQLCMDRYRGLVWALARRMLGGSTDVEDAVQEVFIDLWKSAGRFEPSLGSEATFVAMIARRRFIDHRRRRTREDSVELSSIENVQIPVVEAQTDRPELVEEAARAAQAMGKLRPDQQAVLRLAVYEGWSHQRIAQELQIPLGTVKTHARRGLQRVREMLARQEGPSDPDKRDGFHH